MEADLKINDRITIPAAELHYSFARSTGPGGQHVNKTNTKVLLRWNVTRSRALPGGVRGRFLERFGARINKRGEVLIAGDQHREQSSNRRACQERLQQMVQSVAVPPKRRVRTKPPRRAVEKRLREKRATGEKKQQRKFRGRLGD